MHALKHDGGCRLEIVALVLLGFDAQGGGGRWWFQEVHGFGRLLADCVRLGTWRMVAPTLLLWRAQRAALKRLNGPH